MTAQARQALKGLGGIRWSRLLLYAILVFFAVLYLIPV
jgi:hypothetical protein